MLKKLKNMNAGGWAWLISSIVNYLALFGGWHTSPRAGQVLAPIGLIAFFISWIRTEE